jgi:Tol biopolymer transport system component
MIGKTLSHYQILETLGAGGMGEVFRARDTKLERDVAIKVLPGELAADEERLARFKREAKLLAALNHANIGTIHGLEEADGVLFLVLELIEGETLEQRLHKGPVPMPFVLAIARQMAEALEEAHGAGIVHRDVKPANVLLTGKGGVKVVDFGIAKALDDGVLSDSDPDAPTASLVDRATQRGAILGTLAYMSPEQARGVRVDRRSDIWAFGCVVYEMLTRRKAFAADMPSDTLARIIEREPDWSALPAGTPPSLRRLLRRCLRKDPSERLRHIGDARLEIDEAGTEVDSGGAKPAHRWDALGGWVAPVGALVIAAVAGLAGWGLAGRPALQDTVPLRLDMVFPADQDVVTAAATPIIVSPDGGRIAYVARNDRQTLIYLRELDRFEPTAVPGSEGAQSPIFDPTGRWVAYCANGRFWKAPIAGGEPAALGDCPGILLGASWGSDDSIVFANSVSTGLWRLPASGGSAAVLTAPDVTPTQGHRFPYQMPDGSGVLFSTETAEGRGQLGWLPTGSRDWKVVAEHDSRFTGMKYLDDGHLLFGQRGSIKSVGFDSDAGELVGEPRMLITDAASSPVSQFVYFSASDAGTVAYVPLEAMGEQGGLVWLDGNGQVSDIATVPGGFYFPRLSPDGSRVAIGVRARGPLDAWVYDVAGGRGVRVTRNAEASFPVWSPAGQRLLLALGDDLFVVDAGAAGSPQLVLQRGRRLVATDWSVDRDDEERIFFAETGTDGTTDVRTLTLGDETDAPVLATNANERSARLAPGGRWLAYVSDETGRNEVYIQSFPDGGQKTRVSVDGGDQPCWTADGSELYYRHNDVIFAAPVSEAGRLGDERVVASAPPGVSFELGYDIAPDGRLVVAINFQDFQGVGATRFRILFDWIGDGLQ